MDNFNIYKEALLTKVESAWKQDEFGEVKCAYETYKGASIFYMLHHLAQLIRMSMDRGDCDMTRFKIPCVEENLACLSRQYKTDYKKVWEGLKKTYGIEQCCSVGIGSMVIESEDCDSFKVR
jgi:hypothetical protein